MLCRQGSEATTVPSQAPRQHHPIVNESLPRGRVLAPVFPLGPESCALPTSPTCTSSISRNCLFHQCPCFIDKPTTKRKPIHLRLAGRTKRYHDAARRRTHRARNPRRGTNSTHSSFITTALLKQRSTSDTVDSREIDGGEPILWVPTARTTPTPRSHPGRAVHLIGLEIGAERHNVTAFDAAPELVDLRPTLLPCTTSP